jgi:hypothetical protein
MSRTAGHQRMRLRSGCMLPDGSGAHMSADMPVRNIGQQLTRGPLSEHRKQWTGTDIRV